MKRKVVGAPALDEERNAYIVARWDVGKGAPENVNLERLDVLDYIGSRKYLDAERFGVLPVKDYEICINTNILIRLRAHGAFNL